MRRLKQLVGWLALILLVGLAVFLVPTIWFKPWSIDHFYGRVFFAYALKRPMTLTSLGILEKKGYVTHRREGPRYVYRPTVSPDRARKAATRHLTRTFFGGKPSRAILALLDLSAEKIPREELDEIAARIERAARETSQ